MLENKRALEKKEKYESKERGSRIQGAKGQSCHQWDGEAKCGRLGVQFWHVSFELSIKHANGEAALAVAQINVQFRDVI